jgi:hypothetical protein
VELDSLEVKIKGISKPAVDSVEKLIICLGKLSDTLSSVNDSSLTGLANNVNTLGSSVKDFSRIKSTDFNRIVKNIDKFSKIDSSKISQLSNTFIPLANGVTAISSVSFENKGLTNFINALTRLSNSNFNTQLAGLCSFNAVCVVPLIITSKVIPPIFKCVYLPRICAYA